jgi:hypothetical protein
VFILSAPRSGSTLLQRILASHSCVATTSEPWVLLPLLSPMVADLPAQSGREPLIQAAVNDFVRELPRDRADYRAAVRTFALELYGKLSPPPATHFVDKTPLYHLIVDEVVNTFPDGKFIFLFRNPLSVLASSIELFDDGRWEVARYHMALFQSFADLVPAWQRYQDRAIKVRYEDLVAGEESRWRALTDYLELSWESEMLDSFSDVRLRGRMGDVTGTRAYSALSTAPLTKWRETICNPLRRSWCLRYLRWLGRERLAIMGYDIDELTAELGSAGRTGRYAADDAYRLAGSFVREIAKARLPANISTASTWRALLSPPDQGLTPTGTARP